MTIWEVTEKMNNSKVYTSHLLGEKYYEIVHNSGLKVYVFPKNMSGTYAIFSTKFGGMVSEYTRDGKYCKIPMGCAHFLEHKMFDNKGRAGADDIFSALGAYDNAYTSSERTAYLFSCTENFDECLTELLSFVTQPYFTRKSVKKEIGIIAEEIRGCLDDPYDRCHMNLLSAMYHNSNVKNEICGTERSISKIKPRTLYKCCRDFYTPENMILTVCGNVTCEQVMAVVDKVIKAPKKKHKIKVIEKNEPSHVRTDRIDREMAVSKPIVCIGIKDTDIPKNPKERLRKVAGVNILTKMLFAESGDFYLNMLDEGILTPNFDCGYSSSAEAAYTLIWDESGNPELLQKKIMEHIESSMQNGLDRSAFEREKRASYAAFVADFDSTEDIAFALLSYADEGLDVFEYPEILNTVTFEYVTELLGCMFQKEKFSMSTIQPLNQN